MVVIIIMLTLLNTVRKQNTAKILKVSVMRR